MGSRGGRSRRRWPACPREQGPCGRATWEMAAPALARRCGVVLGNEASASCCQRAPGTRGCGQAPADQPQRGLQGQVDAKPPRLRPASGGQETPIPPWLFAEPISQVRQGRCPLRVWARCVGMRPVLLASLPMEDAQDGRGPEGAGRALYPDRTSAACSHGRPQRLTLENRRRHREAPAGFPISGIAPHEPPQGVVADCWGDPQVSPLLCPVVDVSANLTFM